MDTSDRDSSGGWLRSFPGTAAEGEEGEPTWKRVAAEVHPTAVVSSEVVLEEGVRVGPWCRLEGAIRIGAGTTLESHVVITGAVVLGQNNRVSPFVCLGGAPQDRRSQGALGSVRIGDGNIIREYVTMHGGTADGRHETRVGSDCFFMVGAHVAHDCAVADRVTLANHVSLAGHVCVEDAAFLGGLVGVHQGTRIGRLAMIGAGSMVSQDIPPFCLAHGDHARLIGLNRVGLERAGFSSELQRVLKRAFRTLFGPKGTLSVRLAMLEHSCSAPECEELVRFVQGSSRGIASVRSARRTSLGPA